MRMDDSRKSASSQLLLRGGTLAESHRLGADRNLAVSMGTRNALHRELSFVQAICHGRKGRRRPRPEQSINSCEERKISSKRSKVSEEKCQTGIAVCCVTNQGEVVGNGAWFDSELLYDPLFIPLETPAPVKLHHSRSLNALSKIFIRGTDDHALNSSVLSCEESCR